MGQRPAHAEGARDAAAGTAAAEAGRGGSRHRGDPGDLRPRRRTAKPNAGRVTIRRLNRTEYNNTIRDLVGVDFKPADDFPADDVGYGFDNIGDVLSVSPLLLEKYLSAAEAILDQAIVIADPPKPTKQTFDTIRTGSIASRGGTGQDRSRSTQATTSSGARSAGDQARRRAGAR